MNVLNVGAARSVRVIVNADDLGRSEGINEGIFAAHDHGIVTSATLMVGFEAARHAAAGWARRPRLGVGLHVTLSGARPTLPPERIPSLVDASGHLPRYPDGLAGARPEEVQAEIESQLARFRALTGRDPGHFDSHHHSHCQPVVLAALIAVARREGLPVRRSSPEVAARLAAAGVRTTDRFEDRFFGEQATIEVLLGILASAAPGTTEVMCHPGRVDDELRATSGYSDDREREIAVLVDPRLRVTARELGVVWSRFEDLAG